MKQIKNNIHIITLGCSKNTVDSEQIHFQLSKSGYNVEHNSILESCDTAIVNTCGFINDAKEESINTIIELITLKKAGRVKNIIVFGCLVQRYHHELKEELPEVNVWLGNFNLNDLLNTLNVLHKKPRYGRINNNAGHFAYLKIAEGCNRNCAFCAIPHIKGPFISRSTNNIKEEAIWLAKQGVKELLVIAQDLSYYGYDSSKKAMLPALVKLLSDIESIEWIRLHYLYPALFPEALIDMMAENNKICNYADIPFQHISDNMLKAMRRGHTKTQSMQLIDKLRNKIPDIALRTTLLTGFPGETEKDVEELAVFVRAVRFERLGIFTYSHEENTFAGDSLMDNIPDKEKADRAEYIMNIQEEISYENNQKHIGKTLRVIVDSVNDAEYTGRTEYDSVEVDNEVIFTSGNTLVPGDFTFVKITEASTFELFGEA
jgi:ribosomal protein S12 methylthiotransferase